ncbi:MAG TPA: hypothetical protein HA319_05265 [Nitrosopumilaceae archaeon]|nr:hypothetical protein [Nitrosopumilaceae archaeon]
MSNNSVIFEVSTTKYEVDKERVTLVMKDLQLSCGISDGFLLSSPVEKFGWTFFKILFKNELLVGIQEKFGTQIMHTKGNAFQEKFSDFVTKFFESKNCKIRMKLVED